MKTRVPYLIMSVVFLIFLIAFHTLGLLNGYEKSTFENTFISLLIYLVVAVWIFWYGNLIFGKSIRTFFRKRFNNRNKVRKIKSDISNEEISLSREMRNFRARKYSKIESQVYNDFKPEILETPYSNFSENELTKLFNSKVGLKYYNKTIQQEMNYIHSEFINREIDYSKIGDFKSLSFANPILIENKKVKITTGNN